MRDVSFKGIDSAIDSTGVSSPSASPMAEQRDRVPGISVSITKERLPSVALDTSHEMPTSETKGDRPARKQTEDDLLVQEAVAGNKESFRLLVEKYQGKIFACAFEILKNREDARDVAQESFVKAYVSLGKFKGESSFYTWVLPHYV